MATVCPQCGIEVADYAALQEHCRTRGLCAAKVVSLLAWAQRGIRLCSRCELPLVGQVQIVQDGAGGTEWVHDDCLTAAERAEIARESDTILAEIATANTDPRLVGLPVVGTRQSSVASGQLPVASSGNQQATGHGPRATDRREPKPKASSEAEMALSTAKTAGREPAERGVRA